MCRGDPILQLETENKIENNTHREIEICACELRDKSVGAQMKIAVVDKGDGDLSKRRWGGDASSS